MTTKKPPAPYLDEIDARIAEAKEHGATEAEAFARWQKAFILRQAAKKQKGRER